MIGESGSGSGSTVIVVDAELAAATIAFCFSGMTNTLPISIVVTILSRADVRVDLEPEARTTSRFWIARSRREATFGTRLVNVQ